MKSTTHGLSVSEKAHQWDVMFYRIAILRVIWKYMVSGKSSIHNARYNESIDLNEIELLRFIVFVWGAVSYLEADKHNKHNTPKVLRNLYFDKTLD